MEVYQNKVPKYLDTFENFKNAIQNCLNQTHTTYKKALDSLLTLKFRTLKKSQIMNL